MGMAADRERQLDIARRELENCVAKRGFYASTADRMLLTIGELDWTCELTRLEKKEDDDIWTYT